MPKAQIRTILLAAVLSLLAAAASARLAPALTVREMASYYRAQKGWVAGAKQTLGYLKKGLSRPADPSVEIVVKKMERDHWPGTPKELYAQELMGEHAAKEFITSVLTGHSTGVNLHLLRRFVESRPFDKVSESAARLLLYATEGHAADAIRALQLFPSQFGIFQHLQDPKFSEIAAGLVGDFDAAVISGGAQSKVPPLGWQGIRLGFLPLLRACYFQHVSAKLIRAVLACYPEVGQSRYASFSRGMYDLPAPPMPPAQTALQIRAISPALEADFFRVLFKARAFSDLEKIWANTPSARPLISLMAGKRAAALACELRRIRPYSAKKLPLRKRAGG